MHLRWLQKSQCVRQHSEGAFTCSLYLELELVPLHSVIFFFLFTGMMSSSVKTASVQLKATKVLSERELHFGAQKWDHGRRSVTLCIKVWRHQRKRNLEAPFFSRDEEIKTRLSMCKKMSHKRGLYLFIAVLGGLLGFVIWLCGTFTVRELKLKEQRRPLGQFGSILCVSLDLDQCPKHQISKNIRIYTLFLINDA